MKIVFWKDNLLSGEHQKHVAEIALDFYQSNGVTKQNFDSGWPFERSILLFMSDEYGSFARLSDDEFNAIWEKYKQIESVTNLLNSR